MLPARPSVKREIQKKLAAMFADPEKVWGRFMVEVKKRIRPPCPDRLAAIFQWLKAQPGGGHQNIGSYLHHPIRVAMLAMRFHPHPSGRLLEMALLHNAHEIGEDSQIAQIERVVGKKVLCDVKKLQVDRNNQYNSDYRKRYYGSISGNPQDLLFLRAVDKIDNLLGMVIFEDGEVKKRYIMEAKEDIVPLLMRHNCGLARFFVSVADTVVKMPCDNKLKKSYQKHLQWLESKA